ncbi:reticulocyte-binding protein 2 homolog a-like [Myripristis murdjan]|uniref:reticulocyte-binding protein 2 homolog a-like n=1 Tax=Myripristis murdjan TaxID=586833 RepID=UPI001175D331|nr:reticulocyte-binding protein 2 homolog a-like [Myripristis murdjan]
MASNSRQYWSMGETKALLNIWADENVQQQMEGVCRNEEVIQFMVEELAKLGIQRTTTQVREKLKKMRHLYKTAKRDGRKNFPFFDLMDSVLGGRVEGQLEAETCEIPKCINRSLTQPDKSHSTESVSAPALKRGTHHILPSRIRPETRKRRCDSDTTKDFLNAMTECHKQWLEKEQELRREEWEREAKLRREEMQQEMALRREEGEREERLRREEMEARRKDSELLTSYLEQIAKFIAKGPPAS